MASSVCVNLTCRFEVVLTILVALNLHDHLLEAPDGLLAAFLGHLRINVSACLVPCLASALLLVLRNAVLEIVRFALGNYLRIVDLSAVGGFLSIAAVEWLVLLILVPSLGL